MAFAYSTSIVQASNKNTINNENIRRSPVFRLNLSFNKSQDQLTKDTLLHRFVEFDPENFEKVMKQLTQQKNLIENLEKSNEELEVRLNAFQNIILKYETIFREEISLYRLHKSKLTTIEKAFEKSESFSKEIEQQITTFLEDYSPQDNKISRFDSLKRIILRFFHQNKLNKKDTLSKLMEINDLITNKQALLERYHTDVKNWKKKMSMTFSSPQTSPLIKQVVGL